jgi:hypothetical protein
MANAKMLGSSLRHPWTGSILVLRPDGAHLGELRIGDMRRRPLPQADASAAPVLRNEFYPGGFKSYLKRSERPGIRRTISDLKVCNCLLRYRGGF